ncbi:MAG: MFS transporter [Chloroflexota bacterium]
MRTTGAVSLETRGSARATIDYPRVVLIGAAHLMNDMYVNLLTAILPYLVLDGKISTTLAGLVLLVYLLGSSLLQPVFGLLADQSGRRIFAIFGPMTVGVGACLTGWVNGAELFALAAFSGIGGAAFHPQAAAMVNGLSPRNKGWSMAIFSTGGNIGFAIGPLLAAGIALIGLRWSPVAIIPGIIVTLFLARYLPHVQQSKQSAGLDVLKSSFARNWRPMSLIIFVIAARSAAQFSLIFFLPLYFHARGSSAELGSLFAFALSLSGAAGGLIGGRISDSHGRRLVVVSSLLAAAPVLAVTLISTGPIAWVLIVASGALLVACNSTTVVQGQELLPANAGVAAGLTLGLAFGLSGVITSGLTALSGHIGVQHTVLLVPLLPLVAGLAGIFVPDRRQPA